MPDAIEPAASGRAKCRGCGRAIQKGELRFGEVSTNPFGEGETLHWFHLGCAALLRPDKLGSTLAVGAIDVEGREKLVEGIEKGTAHRRLPRLSRAERAPSGRARCRLCRELIEKGSLRLGLSIFEDGRPNPIGYIHVQCAEAYFGTADILDRVVRLSPALSPEDIAELARLLAEQRPAPERSNETAPLAKTHGDGEREDEPIVMNEAGLGQEMRQLQSGAKLRR
jgi:hypothetical protein